MAWTVYEHITPSGKRYIGITSKEDPKKRWKCGTQYKKGTAFRGAIDKYGWNDIQHNIVSTDLTEKEAKWLENYLICYYWTFVGFKDSKGYNMTLGGDGSLGYIPTEETRKKLSEIHKGKPFSEEHKRKIRESNKGKNLGKHPTEETRKKLSSALIGNQRNKGKHHTEETKKILSESFKGEKNPNYGKLHTEEAKNRISKANKGRKHTEEHNRKISASLKGRKSPNKGKHLTEETRRKQSASLKGRHLVMVDGKRTYVKKIEE